MHSQNKSTVKALILIMVSLVKMTYSTLKFVSISLVTKI